MLRKTITIILALSMVLSAASFAFAARGDDSYYDGRTLMEAVYSSENLADLMYMAGMFKGTGTDEAGLPKYELERVPTRAEAVTMLVRLLGKEDEAAKESSKIPFTDVPAWAVPYVSYAYNSGLTKGISDTAFGSNRTITAHQYATFMMRALGYTEENRDFSYATAIRDFNMLGGTGLEKEPARFTRGDMVDMSANTLMCYKANTNTPLIEALGKGFVTLMTFGKEVDSQVNIWSCFTGLLYAGENIPVKATDNAVARLNPSENLTHNRLLSYLPSEYGAQIKLAEELTPAFAGADNCPWLVKNFEHHAQALLSLFSKDYEWDYYVMTGESKDKPSYIGIYPAMGSLFTSIPSDKYHEDYMMFFDVTSYFK